MAAIQSQSHPLYGCYLQCCTGNYCYKDLYIYIGAGGTYGGDGGKTYITDSTGTYIRGNYSCGAGGAGGGNAIKGEELGVLVLDMVELEVLPAGVGEAVELELLLLELLAAEEVGGVAAGEGAGNVTSRFML